MVKIPEFRTLDEAVEFWESQDTAEYWEDMEEVQFEIHLHQNLLHPKLVVLTHCPERCPRCRHNSLKNITIEYIVADDERLIIIRDVPALQCQINEHKYILEKTLDEVEQLLVLEKSKKLQPTTTLNVPVFSLKMAA